MLILLCVLDPLGQHRALGWLLLLAGFSWGGLSPGAAVSWAQHLERGSSRDQREKTLCEPGSSFGGWFLATLLHQLVLCLNQSHTGVLVTCVQRWGCLDVTTCGPQERLVC